MSSSPEMETLDQLLGGPMTLRLVRTWFPSDTTFLNGVHGLLKSGDVILLDVSTARVPPWRWRALFDEGAVMRELEAFVLDVTAQGIAKVT